MGGLATGRSLAAASPLTAAPRGSHSRQRGYVPAGQAAPTQWTEAQFEKFWHNAARFIAKGKAGWGTRLTKESQGGNTWRVRLFTWAEVLGHLWLVLLVSSGQLTRAVPMQWVSGDGTVIVQMPMPAPTPKPKPKQNSG